MTEREKVIYSIERCTSHVPDACRDCAYDAGQPYNECVEMLLHDALELLKAQEPVKPIPTADDDWTCGNCGEGVVGYTELDACGFVPYKFTYCPRCGLEVKW